MERFQRFVLKRSVGKVIDKYIFCWMSFLIWLVSLVTKKNVQYVGTCVKCCFIYVLSIWLLGFVIVYYYYFYIYKYCIIGENLPYIGRFKLVSCCALQLDVV